MTGSRIRSRRYQSNQADQKLVRLEFEPTDQQILYWMK